MFIWLLDTEADPGGALYEKGFLGISQNSQENTCVILLKKKLCHSCFPVSFAKFLRTPFCTE